MCIYSQQALKKINNKVIKQKLHNNDVKKINK
jgi:hypothetical protein